MTKRKLINDFWTRLGLCAEDPVYTKEAHIFNEFCDATQFVVYGEQQCKQLGIEDDARMADFLFQAFVGEAWSWYVALPTHVQTSWFVLKNALYEELSEGKVMKSMRLLCKEWRKVWDFEARFEEIWRAYTQVSYFRHDFMQFLKSQMLEMHYQVRLEWAKAQSIQKVPEEQPLTTMEFACDEVVSTRTNEWM